MLQILSSLILKAFGWKITGVYPKNVDKKILAAGPHTSNWDFPLGLIVRVLIEDKVQFIGKASLFKPPFGWAFKALGGVPVDRSKSNNFVDSVVEEFNKRPKLSILFAPEGTRKKVKTLKTGFYFIAKNAQVPILPCILDFEKKEFRFLDLFFPSDNTASDLIKIEQMFRGIKGKNPEQGF